jgi:hypothetical protein
MKYFYLSLLLILSLTSCQHKSTPFSYKGRTHGSGEGAEDDALSRKTWEWKRLRDPATGRIPAMIREKELAFAATLPNDASSNVSRRSNTNGVWDFRGPWNVGGRTRALAIDAANENNILAGGVSAGMWRSTDGGVSWTRTTPVNSYPGVNALAQDTRPGHQNTWYYLSGEAYGTSASGGGAFYLGNGMYKSLDSGVTWTSLASTVTGTPQSFDDVWDVTWNVVTDPFDTVNDVVYAACYDAIYRSSNGGSIWTLVRGNAGNLSTSCYFTDVAVADSGVVYASLSSDGPQKGIWRSADGTNFVDILPPGFPPVYDRLGIGVDPNDPKTVYFFGPTPGYGRMSTDFLNDTLWNSLWKYQYVSGNGTGAGGIWTNLTSNLPGNIGVFNGMNTQSGYDVVVRVKPGNSNVVFIGGTNIFRSTTGFTDSTHTDVVGGYEIGAALPFVNEYPGHHPDQHMLAFLPSNPNIMYSGCDGGVSKTMDNTATPIVWSERNDGYITSQFYTVAVDHGSTNDIVIGGLQDNGTYFTNSTNSTDPWTHSIDGDGSYCQISNGGQYYYFSKQNGKMAKTTVDANGNMTAYRRFDPIGATGYQFINPFVLDPNNNNLMYMCAGTHIWRNDDLSGIALTNQWDSISTNWVLFPDSVTGVGEEITALAISTNPPNRLYFGTDKHNVYKIDNANTGTPSKVGITSSLFPASGFVSCIAVNPLNADQLMVVFSNYSIYSLFYSSDGGTSFIKVAGNLEQGTTGIGNGPSCRWASILPVSDGVVYLVATSTGLYSTDTLISGATVWTQQGLNSIGRSVVDMIDTRISDGLVVIGTHGSGVFSTHITSVNDITTGIKFIANAGPDFNLYPNPVNSMLKVHTIEQELNKNWRTTLRNELGQTIRTLQAITDEKGNFSIDVSDLRSGIYYLTLESDNRSMSKSFIKR